MVRLKDGQAPGCTSLMHPRPRLLGPKASILCDEYLSDIMPGPLVIP
jgi:hypothetical protein